MSLNLPASALLKTTKGSWDSIVYPATAVVQVLLTPQDYFEPVPPDSSRSFIVQNSEASIVFDSNTGKVTVRSPNSLPRLSLTLQEHNGSFEVTFDGRLMQLEHSVANAAEVHALLYNAEYTIPAGLSLSCGLAIHSDSVEIAIGDHFEARRETTFPTQTVKVCSESGRQEEIVMGLELLGLTLKSSRFSLATGYLREALFLSAHYYSHNPYFQALNVILKCSQVLEILFGSRRDQIRDHCRDLGVPEAVVESQVVPITLARHSLGSGHGSSFRPRSSFKRVSNA